MRRALNIGYDQSQKVQSVRTLQLNIYTGSQMVYTNTVLMESIKLIPKNIHISINEHKHPINSIAEFPFIVLNDGELVLKEKVIKLVITLIELSVQANFENMRLQHFSVIRLMPLFNLCQQLSEVASVLAEVDQNPYFLFLSPLKKYKIYKNNQSRRKKLLEKGDYLKNEEQLNAEYFLYKLNVLSKTMETLSQRQSPTHIVAFHSILLIALIKHFRLNNDLLLKIAMQEPIFRKVEEERTVFLSSLQKFRKEGKQQPAFFLHVNLGIDRKKEDPVLRKQDNSQKIARLFFKSIAAIALMLAVYKFQK